MQLNPRQVTFNWSYRVWADSAIFGKFFGSKFRRKDNLFFFCSNLTKQMKVNYSFLRNSEFRLVHTLALIEMAKFIHRPLLMVSVFLEGNLYCLDLGIIFGVIFN